MDNGCPEIVLLLVACFGLSILKNLYTTVLYIFKRIVKLLMVVFSLDDGCPEVLFLKDWS